MPVYITEYMTVPDSRLPIPHGAYTVEQVALTISGTSAQSAAFNAGTKFVRVFASEKCSVSIGSNPTATADSTPIAAEGEYYASVQPGDKLAAITRV